jgi:glyoxylase I family protein
MRKILTLFGLVIGLVIGGCMTQHEAPQRSTGIWRPTSTDDAVVRYLVADLDRAIEFYTARLGFKLQQRAGPIAVVSRGSLNLLLSGPESSGARPLADGQSQQPGGWNRIVLYVDDVEAVVDHLRSAGVMFRNDIKVGPGGKQIQLADPDGNAIELHEAPA